MKDPKMDLMREEALVLEEHRMLELQILQKENKNRNIQGLDKPLK